MKPTKSIVIVAGKRTPFGGFGGSLKDLTATDLGVAAAKATLDSIGAKGDCVDAVVFGNVCQTSADASIAPRGFAASCRSNVASRRVEAGELSPVEAEA